MWSLLHPPVPECPSAAEIPGYLQHPGSSCQQGRVPAAGPRGWPEPEWKNASSLVTCGLRPRVTKPYGVVTLGRCGRDRAAQAVGSGLEQDELKEDELKEDELKEDELEPCSSRTAGSRPLLHAVPSGCPVPSPLPEHLRFLWTSRDGIINCGMRSGVTTWKKMSLEPLPWSAGGRSVPRHGDMVAPRAGRAALPIFMLRGHPRLVTRGDDTARSLPGASGARGRRVEGTGEDTAPPLSRRATTGCVTHGAAARGRAGGAG